MGITSALSATSSGALVLDAGAHRLELRADGYESLTLDVQIAPAGLITYRSALKAVSAAPAPQAPASTDAAPAHTTIYMIPGCYVGNLPPREAGLPAGCDESRAVVLPRALSAPRDILIAQGDFHGRRSGTARLHFRHFAARLRDAVGRPPGSPWRRARLDAAGAGRRNRRPGEDA